MTQPLRKHNLDGLSPAFAPSSLQHQQPAVATENKALTKHNAPQPASSSASSSDDESSSYEDIFVQRKLPSGKYLLATVPAPIKIKRTVSKPRSKRILLPPPPPPPRPTAAAAAVAAATVTTTVGASGYDSDYSVSSGEPQRTTLIGRANDIMHLSPVDKFRKVFVLVNQLMDFESLGTFDIDPRYKLQYLAGAQPIPDGVVVRSVRLHQTWAFSIHYALTGDGRSTVLRFRILHMPSGQVTERTESAKQAETRNRYTRWRTIANSLFLEAVAVAAEYYAQRALEGVEGAEHAARQLSSKGSTGRKSTDHIGMFGLRSAEMQAFVLQYLSQH